MGVHVVLRTPSDSQELKALSIKNEKMGKFKGMISIKYTRRIEPFGRNVFGVEPGSCHIFVNWTIRI